ncbi:hypothetical protein AVEN_221473-1 [Araneus ventricosus]|uniref:Uncharacterized protein n=1 Tax=Araneus ventricosus TaxID=182803 RepID=A0A4Y2NR88_ARAVE|nr:hypothetical protein AVEN_221471-1 [Araneus ventricosus]GBN41851.1 hypothetical protein AVEN_221473-1 [Araneus ventricosus]
MDVLAPHKNQLHLSLNFMVDPAKNTYLRILFKNQMNAATSRNKKEKQQEARPRSWVFIPRVKQQRKFLKNIPVTVNNLSTKKLPKQITKRFKWETKTNLHQIGQTDISK